MAKQKKPPEAAEQLHNQDEVDLEHIKELMGPPPLESVGNDAIVPETDFQEAAKEASTAPPLDPEVLKEQFAENLSVNADDKVNISVMNPTQTSDDVESSLAATNAEISEANRELTKRPSKAETPNTGLVSSEDFDDPEISPNIEDDPELDKAVDEIVSQESDELLAANDEKLNQQTKVPKISFAKRFKGAWSWWWHNSKTRGLSIFILIASLVAIVAIPKTRYLILNTAGVRVRASVRVIDQSTLQPLKNAEVSLAGVTVKTDTEGKAVFQELRLGKTELIIQKRAFAEQKRTITLGWGSNPLDEARMQVTGTVYNLKITDYFSSRPIEKIEAVSGEFTAISDKDGKIALAIDKVTDSDPEITIDHPDYRLEKFVATSVDEKEVKLAPRNPHVFISKRSGKFDLYKVDADGANEQLLLAGTGKERDDIYILPNISEQKVAHVSTRDGQRNKDGYLLSSLYVVDSISGEQTRLVLTERVQMIGWYKKRLLYIAIAEGASAANPNRQKIFSYDIETEEKKELATNNYFNDVLLATNNVFYAPSSALNTSGAENGLYRINLDTSEKKRLFDQEVWNLIRSDYEKLTLSTQQDWYDVKLDDGSLTKLGGAPAVDRSREYVTSPDGTYSLWVDERDGKGVVLRYDLQGKKDEVTIQRSGIRYPVSWLSNRVFVFRVADGREVADYVFSLDAPEPVKLRDVTNTGSIDHSGY